MDRIMAYMTGDGGTDEGVPPEKELSTEETALEDSYDRFFTAIEELYPEADRQNDELFHAVAEFAAIHDNAYFRTGVIVGFRLYKEFEEGYARLDGMDIPAALEQCGLVGHRAESLLEQFFDARLSEALEDSLRRDRRYQSARAEARRKVKRLEDMGLRSRRWRPVDQVLSACNSSASEYGRAAYVLGFQDAVDVIVELQGRP